MQFSNHSREIERQIIVLLVEDLLAAGYELGVNDGEEDVLKNSKSAEEVYSHMSTTDEDYLLVYKGGDKIGWIRLIYGNDADVISDYTVNIPESVFERAEELAERFRG